MISSHGIIVAASSDTDMLDSYRRGLGDGMRSRSYPWHIGCLDTMVPGIAGKQRRRLSVGRWHRRWKAELTLQYLDNQSKASSIDAY
jgi:hypothetical protein